MKSSGTKVDTKVATFEHVVRSYYARRGSRPLSTALMQEFGMADDSLAAALNAFDSLQTKGSQGRMIASFQSQLHALKPQSDNVHSAQRFEHLRSLESWCVPVS